MALFGAPIAHEDHAERACHAALSPARCALTGLRRRGAKRRHGSNFDTRIGLNSGEVVVGKIGDDLRMDYTAQGHTVGLAQRVEELAGAGLREPERTHREDRGGLLPAARPGRVPPSRREGHPSVSTNSRAPDATERGSTGRAPAGLTQFVGRMAELSALQTGFERALEGRAAGDRCRRRRRRGQEPALRRVRTAV